MFYRLIALSLIASQSHSQLELCFLDTVLRVCATYVLLVHVYLCYVVVINRNAIETQSQSNRKR